MKRNHKRYFKKDQEHDHEQEKSYSILDRALILVLALFLISCGENYTPEQKAYIKKIEKHRTDKNGEMKNDSSSPFNRKGKIEDPNHVYTIDFNLAYNPYCAYSPNFSCAIPTKEDFITIAINAGEKKFHD